MISICAALSNHRARGNVCVHVYIPVSQFSIFLANGRFSQVLYSHICLAIIKSSDIIHSKTLTSHFFGRSHWHGVYPFHGANIIAYYLIIACFHTLKNAQRIAYGRLLYFNPCKYWLRMQSHTLNMPTECESSEPNSDQNTVHHQTGSRELQQLSRHDSGKTTTSWRVSDSRD